MRCKTGDGRAGILEAMAGITRLRRGTLTRQVIRAKQADGSERQRGPYYTLQTWRKGKNHSQRIPAERYAQVRRDVQEYKRFLALAKRFVALAERTALAEDLLASADRPAFVITTWRQTGAD